MGFQRRGRLRGVGVGLGMGMGAMRARARGEMMGCILMGVGE